MSMSYFPGKSYGWNKGSYQLAMPLRHRPKKGTYGAPVRKGARVQTKPSKSQTKTQTMTRKRRFRKGGIASDKGVSFFSYSCKSKRLPKAIFRSMVGNQQILTQAGFQMKGTVGRQVIEGSNKLGVGNRIDLLAIRDKVCPLVLGVRDPRSVKIFLRSVRNVIHLRNQTNVPIKVKLFDIRCKQNTTGTATDDPVSAWVTGIADDTTTANNHLLVGQMPGQSQEFRYFYKIMQERVLELQPGAFHEHFFKINYNKMLDTTQLDNLSSTADALSYWSFYTLIVAYGSIGSDSASGTGAVTYLPVNLDVCYNKVYKYGYLEKNQPKYDIESTHDNTLTVAQLHSMISNDFQATTTASAV